MTALFAPEPDRETLFTLYAFNHELARAREVTQTPVLALIRLQWWREVVEGEAKRHEVATPLRAAIAADALSVEALAAMIEARMLEAEPAVDEAAWHRFVDGAGGVLMEEAGRVLGATQADRASLRRAGAGCAAVGLLRNRTASAQAGRAPERWWFPDGWDAARAREAADGLLGAPVRWPRRVVAAALPVVFARRALRRGAGPDGLGRLAVWAAARRRYF